MPAGHSLRPPGGLQPLSSVEGGAVETRSEQGLGLSWALLVATLRGLLGGAQM